MIWERNPDAPEESEEDQDGSEDEEVEEPRGDPGEPEEGEEEEEGTESLPKGVVDRLRQENAKYRKRIKEIDDANKTETQRITEERDNLRTENEAMRSRLRRSNFIEKVGVSSPRLAWAALQDLSVAVEWDDKDQASNLPEIRKALKREFPEDFGDRSVNGGETGQAPADSDMNSRIRAAAGR